MLLDDAVHVLPLLSALLWAVIAVGAFARYSVASPFVRALTLFCLLVSAACVVDWYLLTFLQSSAGDVAIALANLRTSLLILASLVILLASKWISRGHARYDAILAIPIGAAIVVVWSGMTLSVSDASWGPAFARDPLRYGFIVVLEVAYYVAAVVFASSLVIGRRDLPHRLRRPALLSIAALPLFVALWLSTNVYATLVNPQVPLLFSSVLFVPALLDVIAFMNRSPEEMGEIFRAVSDVERRVQAIYVFYRSGEPLAAVASSRTYPIEAEQLQGVLDIVGNFVETSMKQYRGYSVTAMHFDRLGIVAVRGQFIIAAAVFEGAAYDALRSELLRTVRDFESRRWDGLSTWEGASAIAEEVADRLSQLLQRPSEGRTSEGQRLPTRGEV